MNGPHRDWMRLIRHIARLSRIRLNDDEIESYRVQLSRIVEYFDKLQELDTDGVEPFVHAVELENILAADRVEQSLSVEETLSNAPRHDGFGAHRAHVPRN